MKKLTLINFLLFLAVKANGSCAAEVNGNSLAAVAADQTHTNYYFFAVFALAVPLAASYFLRKRKGLWAVLAGIAASLLLIPVLIGTFIFVIGLGDHCGAGRSGGNILAMIIKGDFLIMLSLFTYQFSAWICQTKWVKDYYR